MDRGKLGTLRCGLFEWAKPPSRCRSLPHGRERARHPVACPAGVVVHEGDGMLRQSLHLARQIAALGLQKVAHSLVKPGWILNQCGQPSVAEPPCREALATARDFGNDPDPTRAACARNSRGVCSTGRSRCPAHSGRCHQPDEFHPALQSQASVSFPALVLTVLPCSLRQRLEASLESKGLQALCQHADAEYLRRRQPAHWLDATAPSAAAFACEKVSLSPVVVTLTGSPSWMLPRRSSSASGSSRYFSTERRIGRAP